MQGREKRIVGKPQVALLAPDGDFGTGTLEPLQGIAGLIEQDEADGAAGGTAGAVPSPTR